MTKQNRNTWLFLGFLLLAGVMHRVQENLGTSMDTLLFAAIFLIYAGLLLFWINSVRTRLLPTSERNYMILTTFFMLSYLVIRCIKYRIATEIAEGRHLVYLYSLPVALTGSFFLMACIRIRRGSGKGRRYELILLLPALALAALFLTNDLHFLVYRPLVPMADFVISSGACVHGTVFCLLYLWLGLTVASGIFLLIRRLGTEKWSRVLPAAGILVLYASLLMAGAFLDRLGIRRFYEQPEIHMFCAIGLFETCIRSRLIPYNENYSGFFEKLRVPVLITDENFRTVHYTRGGIF